MQPPGSSRGLGRLSEAERRQLPPTQDTSRGLGQLSEREREILVTPRVTTTETFRVGDLGPNYAGPRYNNVTGREDSPYNKGLGWFGPLISKRKAGDVDDVIMTEYSRTGSIVPGGDVVDYPLLVPTLEETEVGWLLENLGVLNAQGKPKKIPDDIERKARNFARKRINQGLTPFARENEGNWNQYPDIRRVPRDQMPASDDTRGFGQLSDAERRQRTFLPTP